MGGYEDSYDKMERENTLTPKEVESVKEFHARTEKAQSEFGGKMRELEADPHKVVTMQFTVKMAMSGEFLKTFLWLNSFLVQTGLTTKQKLIQGIIQNGVQVMYVSEQAQSVQAMMRQDALQGLPDEAKHLLMVRAAKELVSMLSETEKQSFKESMESDGNPV